MKRCILQKFNLKLAVLLLSCWVPVLNAGLAQAKDQCSEAQIKANITKFKDGKDYNDYFTAKPAFETVVKCESKSIQPLIEAIRNKKVNAEIRRKAADALERIGKGSELDVKTLVAVVADKQNNAEVRYHTASALWKIGKGLPADITTLVTVAADKKEDVKVRSHAASSLGGIRKGSESDVKTLVAIVADQNDHATVRFNAAYALGRIGKASESDVKTLVAIVADQNDHATVRSTTAYALRTMGKASQSNAQVLVDILTNKVDSVEVRFNAAYALGTIGKGSVPAVNQLVNVLIDKQDYATVRANAADALGTIGKGSVPAVNQLVNVLIDKQDHAEVRANAANALGNIAEESEPAIKALVTVVADQSDDAKVHEGTIRSNATYILEKIAFTLQKQKDQLSTRKLDKLIPEFEKAIKVLENETENQSFQETLENIRSYLSILKEEKQSRWVEQAIEKGAGTWATHALFWVILIFIYPHSSQVQATFFWNPYIRKIFGLGYVGFALTWIPFLRTKLFSPFRDSLLSDADLASFDPETYFKNLEVIRLGEKEAKSIQEAIPKVEVPLILEGESGLGKSMFLRHLAQSSRRIAVYLPASKCEQGVIEAIQKKLHGQAQDSDFLKNLIYGDAIDIYIDGLNEVTPDTRAKISEFAEKFFKGNILLTTQPLEWKPPSTAATYILQPLKGDKIREFLLSRQTLFLKDNLIPDPQTYTKACETYLNEVLSHSSDDEALRRMLSNPMELTIVAQMLAKGKQPDLLNLQQQQYEVMATEYERINGTKFPLKSFAEMAYQMRLDDQVLIPSETWQKELLCMERYKMVLCRLVSDNNGKSVKQWRFRHDKIQEFFIVQTFLGTDNDKPQKHIHDPRFRGVYFLLATMLPLEAAMQLRETLIQYAADTKDHTVSDTCIQLIRSRPAMVNN